jgi:hypothetical protein
MQNGLMGNSMIKKNDMEVFRRIFLDRLRKFKNLNGSTVASIMASFDHTHNEANLEISGLKKQGQCQKKNVKEEINSSNISMDEFSFGSMFRNKGKKYRYGESD